MPNREFPGVARALMLMGWHRCMEEFKAMLDRPLARVVLSDDKERVEFHFESGEPQAFGAEGDCCSHSWIEHLEYPGAGPESIVGARILDIMESNGPEPTAEDKAAAECLETYATTFRTDRGDIVLEYRNDSNGYYGGYLVPVQL